ncbi:UNVERIFIED_CONTAM: uncharacterized protein DUF1624 [Acetivibrio alkalicellulosi]
MNSLEKPRDLSIDTLRGLAVFTMICANLGAEILTEPHPLLFRFYGTFAAPIFILLSGYMTSFSSSIKKYNLSYFIMRGLVVLLFAVFVDMVLWLCYPLVSFDVLYILALGIPLTYLFGKLRFSLKVLLVLAIFSITPLLQSLLSYSQECFELDLTESPKLLIANSNEIIRNFIINGWFPFFPWIGFVFSGSIFYDIRTKVKNFASLKFTLIGLMIFLPSLLSFLHFSQINYVRDGYSELFYPATPLYIIMAIGLIIILFSIIDFTKSFKIYNPIRILGKRSLYVYISHIAIINYLLVNILDDINMPLFLLVYIGLTIFLVLTAHFFGILKAKLTDNGVKLPYIIKVLF